MLSDDRIKLEIRNNTTREIPQVPWNWEIKQKQAQKNIH